MNTPYEVKNLNNEEESVISAIRTQLAKIPLEDVPEDKTCIAQLVQLIYAGYEDGVLFKFDSETALEVLKKCQKYKCEHSESTTYHLAMIGLAVSANQMALLTLLYSLLPETEKTPHRLLCDKVESVIAEYPPDYAMKVTDFVKVYEHILTTESLDTIDFCNDIAHNLLQHEATQYKSLASKLNKNIDGNLAVKLVMACSNDEKAWRILSKYSYTAKKWAVNYVANFMLVYRFKVKDHFLANITGSLEMWVDGRLPQNYLRINLYLLNSTLILSSYWNKFRVHIAKNNSFSGASNEIIVAYYQALSSKHFLSEDDRLLLIDILYQTQTFDEFYDYVLAVHNAFDKSLLKNPQHAIRFLAVIACNRQHRLSVDYLKRINVIREQTISFELTHSDRAAMSWIDELLKSRTDENIDDTFFSVSGKILSFYPTPPRSHLIKSGVMPQNFDDPIHHSLIHHWVNTFECFDVVANAYYKLYKIRPSEPNERLKTYRLLYSLVRRLIALNKGPDSHRIGDYARECRNYYAFKALAHDSTVESEQFVQKMRDGFSKKHEFNAVNSFVESLQKFQNSGLDDSVVEEVIYCGISNYWDVFLDKVISCPTDFSYAVEPLMEYLKVLDQRPVRRRLLQIYLFTNIARMQHHQAPASKFLQINNNEIQSLVNDFKNGRSNPETSLEAFRKLATKLYPEIKELITVDVDSKSSDEIVGWYSAMHFALSNLKLAVNNDWVKMDAVLGNNDIPLLCEMFIPCLVFIHTNEECHKIARILVTTQNANTITFLKHPLFRNAIGEFYSDYYTAFYQLYCEKYDEAKITISGIKECPDYMRKQIDELSVAIGNRNKIDLFFDVQSKFTDNMLPQFSFMRSSNPCGNSIEYLIAEFNSESNMQDSRAKCQTAQKIYHYLVEGVNMRDACDFLFRWGFYTIAAETDLEHSACVLFELLDNVEKLNAKSRFRPYFIDEFSRILNGCNFGMLCKYLSRIKDYYKVLYTHYKPIENHECYAQLILLLTKLYDLANKEADPAVAMQQVKDIQKSILAVKASFPQNKFAQNAVKFTEQFIYQIKERGLFEVRILNEDNCFNGSIFYQIKNIGTETIPEVIITMYIDGYMDTTIKEVKVTAKLPKGLRPGQIFAGEYIPGIKDIPNGQEIACILQLNYGDRSYIAVDAKSGGKLFVKKENYRYQKDATSGYLDGTILESQCKSSFVERRELGDIEGALSKRQHVILYGTNGTGKSSVLNWLKQVQIPRMCAEAKILPIAIHMVSDGDCSEEQTINGLLDLLCRKNSTLLIEIKKLRVSHPEINFSVTEELLLDAAEMRNELVLIEENGLNSNRIMELFSMISTALSCSNLALYVLWDNFEKVIASPNINPQHMGFLRAISEKGAGNIQIVFSGSNYLLETVSTVGGNTLWNEILTRSGTTKVKIGNLFYQPYSKSQNQRKTLENDQSDFVRFLTQKRALNNGEIHYSPEAIEYLWHYTNGHAFYSCLIGNRTLEILSTRHVNRSCIYPSDVFNAIYESEKYMPVNKSDKSKENAIENQIFQDISDNIAVKCVGQALGQEIASGKTRVSCARLHQLVYQKRPDITPQDVTQAIEILTARDFIQQIYFTENADNNSKSDCDDEYVFTSDLYLERFLDVSIPELAKLEFEDIERRRRTADEIADDISQGVMSGSITQEKLERIRMLLGSNTTINTGGGAVAGPGGTVNQQIVQINAQTINTAFNTLLHPELSSTSGVQGFLDAFNQLPSLANVVNTELLAEKSEEERAEIVESQVMGGAVSGALLLGDFKDLKIEEKAKLLGIKHDDCKSIFDELNAVIGPFSGPLTFAFMLHFIFDSIYQNAMSKAENEEIQEKAKTVEEKAKAMDFCPVALLYCKLVESILKEKHTLLYFNRLRDATYSSGTRTFGSLGNRGRINPNAKGLKHITIGSFSSHIIRTSDDFLDIFLENGNNRNVYNPELSQYERYDKNTDSMVTVDLAQNRELLMAEHYSPELAQEWENHAYALGIVHGLRNRSAHDLKPITKEQFDWLIDVLFKDGELMRIFNLAKDQPTHQSNVE